MRLTPIQIALHFLCGSTPGMFEIKVKSMSLAQIITEGREELIKITGQDFEYNLIAWHEYLLNHKEVGYPYDSSDGIPKLITSTLESDNWKNAVATLL
ncbi:hypothetical protein PQO03_11545 [Lentisphaera profundi]|uniref:Uncharacterized protein n=1 Tax=Lentisphaera profundi TaxID=1658616 RepID=A0ABY7VWA4_9BACT|nr:hypothetical protein [Lentisphaera profundi]WDE96343.1 hypothetical protein PQO03_11545 [Lentisphaera profundi]